MKNVHRCEQCGTHKWLCAIGPKEAPTIMCGFCMADAVEMGVVSEEEIYELEDNN